MTGVPNCFVDADVAQLRRIYIDTLEDFAKVADSTTEANWTHPSPCPGWSVGDVVAHTLALEAELHGEPLPDHEPDWDSLPHVSGPISQYTELPVDWYRSQPRDVVIGALHEMVEWRRSDLESDTSTDPNEEVLNFAGWRLPRAQMIRTRTLDIWIHNQDIRHALGEPGDFGTDGAWITSEQLIRGLPFVWAKQMSAPIGSSVELRVTGPGVEFVIDIEVNDASRGVVVESLAGDPTVTATMSWPMYVDLAAGREGAITKATSGGVALSGDTELGNELINRFVVTP